MKAKKKKISTYTHLEKILTLAGLALVVVGCVANLYGAYANRRFISDPIDVIYYLRYIVLLGGGFIAGYRLTKKSARRTQYNQLFLGVVYAVLAMALFWLFDLARFGLQGLSEQLSYPWAKIVFESTPLASVLTVLAIAYFRQSRPNRPDLSALAKVLIVVSFIVYQVYTLVSGPYFVLIGKATYNPNVPTWLIIGGYLVTPLAIAVVAYLLFGHIKPRFSRLFYAVLIGMFYSTLTIVLWEFRTDASYEATNIFSNIATALSILFVGVLLWRVRKAIK